MPDPFLTLGYNLKHLDYCWTSLNSGRKSFYTKRQCSLSKRRFISPSPHPNFRLLHHHGRLWKFFKPLATLLCLATQDCCCPDNGSSLADQTLNVTLRKMQLLNFSWRADALFLGFLELSTSSGTETLQRKVMWMMIDFWDSCKSVFAEKWFHRGSYLQNWWL